MQSHPCDADRQLDRFYTETNQFGDEVTECVAILDVTIGGRRDLLHSASSPVVQRYEQNHQTRPDQRTAIFASLAEEVIVGDLPADTG